MFDYSKIFVKQTQDNNIKLKKVLLYTSTGSIIEFIDKNEKGYTSFILNNYCDNCLVNSNVTYGSSYYKITTSKVEHSTTPVAQDSFLLVQSNAADILHDKCIQKNGRVPKSIALGNILENDDYIFVCIGKSTQLNINHSIWKAMVNVYNTFINKNIVLHLTDKYSEDCLYSLIIKSYSYSFNKKKNEQKTLKVFSPENESVFDLANCQNFARFLGDTPSNQMTPLKMTEYLQQFLLGNDLEMDSTKSNKTECNSNKNFNNTECNDNTKSNKTERNDNIKRDNTVCNDNKKLNKTECNDSTKSNKTVCNDNNIFNKAECNDSIQCNKAECNDNIKRYNTECNDNTKSNKTECNDNIKRDNTGCNDNIKRDNTGCNDNKKLNKAECNDNNIFNKAECNDKGTTIQSTLNSRTNNKDTRENDIGVPSTTFQNNKDLNNNNLLTSFSNLMKNDTKIELKILNKDELTKEKMNLVLSVSQGSDQEPVLLQAKYYGRSEDTIDVAMVGKGVTFDTGGISLKPASEMYKLKQDMMGAAICAGVMKVVSKLNLKINLSITLPLVENMISGSATKPGDVFISKSGISVEVDNTDAEGRLILADAITFAQKDDPAYLLDVATLTGAVRVALGNVYGGYFTDDEELSEMIFDSGTESCDPLWRLPLSPLIPLKISSQVADLSNSTKIKLGAGSSYAAEFLKRFVNPKVKWAHFDVSNVRNNHHLSTVFGDQTTARPLPALVSLLKKLENSIAKK